MKKLMFIMCLSMSVLMMSGCVVIGNGGGEKLTDEEKAEIEDAIDEAGAAINEAGEEIGDVLDLVKEEMDEELKNVDWAKEFFEDFDDSNKDIKFIKVSTEDGSEILEIEDEKEFIKNIDVNSWEKIDTLPEGLKKEAEYIIKQQGTETVFGNSADKYYEICRLTLYEGNYVTFDMLSDETVRTFTDVVSEEWFTSVYSVSQETADCLK